MKTGTARTLSTADLARSAEESEQERQDDEDRREESAVKNRDQTGENDRLEPLFLPRAA